MKYIFIIAAFNSFFYTALLLQKKPRAIHDIVLIIWLVYLGFFIGTYSFFSHELFTHFKLLSISLISLFMLHGPFLYIYISKLVSSAKRIFWKDLLHLIPFILFNAYVLFSSFSPEASEKLNLERLSLGYNPPLLFLFFLSFTALSGTVYFLLTIKLFRIQKPDILTTFSRSKLTTSELVL